jgi:hypothetical protein
VHFLLVFQEIADDNFSQTDCVSSNPAGQFVEECNTNNIFKTQHDPTVDSRDIATGALLVFLQNLQLSLFIRFSLFFSSFFLTRGLLQFYRLFFP